MKNDIWWVAILPKHGICAQLHSTRKSADWVWGNVDGVTYKQVKLVPINPKKKRFCPGMPT